MLTSFIEFVSLRKRKTKCTSFIIAASVVSKVQDRVQTVEMRRLLVCKLSVLCVFVVLTSDALSAQRPVVSVLDFGATPTGRQAAETLRSKFRASSKLAVADAD